MPSSIRRLYFQNALRFHGTRVNVSRFAYKESTTLRVQIYRDSQIRHSIIRRALVLNSNQIGHEIWSVRVEIQVKSDSHTVGLHEILAHVITF